MQYTLIDHDKPSLALEPTPCGNRAIIQFETNEAAKAAFDILLDKLPFDPNRTRYILGRSLVINRLSDKEYDKMLRVLKRAK